MIAETANLATVRQVVKEAEIATLGRRVSSKCRAARAKIYAPSGTNNLDCWSNEPSVPDAAAGKFELFR